MQEPVLWSDDYALNIEQIDEQHRHFFKLIGDLFLAVRSPQWEGEKALAALTHLCDYAYYHFDTEEKFFEKAEYPERVLHRKYHEEFRRQTQLFLSRFRAPTADGKKVLEEAAAFAQRWLTQHILAEDKKYVQCLKERGVV